MCRHRYHVDGHLQDVCRLSTALLLFLVQLRLPCGCDKGGKEGSGGEGLDHNSLKIVFFLSQVTENSQEKGNIFHMHLLN